jgi:hypothetical protein
MSPEDSPSGYRTGIGYRSDIAIRLVARGYQVKGRPTKSGGPAERPSRKEGGSTTELGSGVGAVSAQRCAARRGALRRTDDGEEDDE